jgi:hypothetical protein
MIGSLRVARAPPDGYQFVLGSRADAINQTLYKRPVGASAVLEIVNGRNGLCE